MKIVASLTDLFGPGRGTIRHQPAVKHVLGKAAPPASAYEADARRLLTLVWPSVRQMVPTAEERKNGLWSMGPFGPYVGVRPPPLYLNTGEADLHEDLFGGHLARWDGHAIMYDEACWVKLPNQRLGTMLHEALHAVGFVHTRRGTGRAFQRVISRAKRALPEAVLRAASPEPTAPPTS